MPELAGSGNLLLEINTLTEIFIMRKILATILASMSISGGTLAYELEIVKPPDNNFVRQVCIPGKLWKDKRAIKKSLFSDIHWAPIRGVYIRDGRINPYCDTIIKDVANVTPPVLKKEKELVCTRIEGCEINLNATTEEEYCPTCVWKSEMKKIKIINFI